MQGSKILELAFNKLIKGVLLLELMWKIESRHSGHKAGILQGIENEDEAVVDGAFPKDSIDVSIIGNDVTMIQAFAVCISQDRKSALGTFGQKGFVFCSLEKRYGEL